MAKCLGHLALLRPEQVLPALIAAVSSPSAATRVTLVTATKFMMLDAAHPIDTQLQAALPSFLRGLQDSDRLVSHPYLHALSPLGCPHLLQHLHTCVTLY